MSSEFKLNVFATVLFSFLFLTEGKGQQFDKTVLDEKVRLIDTSFKLNEPIYIIDGLPYENEERTKIDSVLHQKGLKYLLSIDVLRDPVKSKAFSCRPMKDVVIICFAHRQPMKKKRKLFNRVCRAFKNNHTPNSKPISKDTTYPVLYINNEIVEHSKAMQTIRDLRIKKIYYIDYPDNIDSSKTYLQNKRNGIVRIWKMPKN
jgi:hypothetical protein